MRLITLGGLRVDGADLRRQKPLLILAYLAIEGPQDRRRVSRLLFPDARDPMASLRVALTRLRRALPNGVHASGTMLRGLLECDAVALLDDVTGRRVLDDFVDRVPGAFLAGVETTGISVELEEWIFATRELLAERVRGSLLAIAENASRRGDRDRSARIATRALSVPGAGPAEPDLLGRAYLVLRDVDRPRAALVARELAEYGIDPPEGGPRTGPESPPVAPRVRHNLTVPLASFVGRQGDLRRIEALFATERERLVTVTGTAGVGKTRLALEAAQEALVKERHGDGVFWVDVEALTDVEQLPEWIAFGLGLSVSGADSPLDQLVRQLRDLRMLVVLDNFEHLVEGSSIPARLVRECPGLELLVTSRERLRVAEERLVKLEGLAYPEGEVDDPVAAMPYDAVRLFTLRAQRHDASFRLDSTTLPHVLRVCRLVDGSPLGLELAAAWVGSLHVEGVSDELQRGSDALASRSRDVVAKHRSLKAALEKSWDLLDDDARRVLRRLAVFRGGFRREAAAAVAGASLSRLADLVDKSLVRLESTGRYDLHPLVHQFCGEKLAQDVDESSACVSEHGRFFRAQASAPDDEVPNPQGGWRNLYERMEVDMSEEALLMARAELPNLLQAWRHYLAVRDADSIAAVIDFHGNTSESWSRSREGLGLMKAALAVLEGSEHVHAIARARVEGAAGVACWRLGAFDDGAELGERALEVLMRLEPPDERLGCWWAAQAAGLCHFQTGRVARALEVLQLGHGLADEGARAAKSVFVRRRLDGMAGLSAAVLGMSAVVAGDLDQARRWSLEARDRMFASTPRAAAYCFYPLASIALAEGAFDDAARWASEGVAHARNVGHDAVLPDLWRSLGYALFRLERYPEAEEVLAEAMVQAARGGNLVYGTPLRATMGRTLVRMHRHAEAAPLLLRALRDAAATGAVPYALDDALLGLAEIAAARGDGLAPRLTRFVADLASAHPLARTEARTMLGGGNDTEPASAVGLERLMDEVKRAFA